MTVVTSTDYAPTSGVSNLLKENGEFLLLETGDKVVLDETTVQPLTHARILHSGNWLAGTVTASSTDADYFAAAPDNSLTYEKWKPATLPATWELDAGAGEVNACGIAAHTCGTSGATVDLEYWDGSAWQSVDTVSPTTDEPILFMFARVPSGRWRISVSGSTAPEIGVIRFGLSVEMTRPIYGGHTPIVFARQTTMRANESETGEFLGRTKLRTSLSTTYSWSHVTADWMREYWLPLQKAIETEPFFIAWRPATFGDVAFGQVMEAPAPQNMGVNDLMAVEMKMTARGYD